MRGYEGIVSKASLRLGPLGNLQAGRVAAAKRSVGPYAVISSGANRQTTTRTFRLVDISPIYITLQLDWANYLLRYEARGEREGLLQAWA
jgi:hypothetical protein